MLIEIKDLPKDRNIKRVSFDIEFEDGEIKTVTPMQSKFVEKAVREEHYGYSTDFVFNTQTSITSERDIPTATYSEDIKREQKEIPPEMKDVEF